MQAVAYPLAGLLLCCCALLERPAWAQQPDPPPAAPCGEEDTEAADAAYQLGRELAEQRNNCEAASAAFEQSHRLCPSRSALYGMAYCLEQLGHQAQAYTRYGEYLEQYPDATDELERGFAERARSARERLRSEVAVIVVEVREPSSAQVSLDGHPLGETPLPHPLVVDAGQHTLEVRAEGFASAQRELELPGGADEHWVVSLVPAGRAGTILVSGELPGVAISLDGQQVGTTPLSSPLIAADGPHVVEAARPGYEPVRVPVTLSVGEASRVALTLRPLNPIPTDLNGELAVQVSEPDAELRLDGEPWTPGSLPIGPHLLEVRREGFQEWSEQVDVTCGEPTRITVELIPTQAFLERYRARARAWRLSAWSTASVSLVLLGTSLGLQLWNSARFDQWDQEARILREPPAEDDYNQRVRDNGRLLDSIDAVDVLNWAFLAVGAAAAVAAAGLFVWGPRRDRYSQVSFMPWPGGMALSVTWGERRFNGPGSERDGSLPARSALPIGH